MKTSLQINIGASTHNLQSAGDSIHGFDENYPMQQTEVLIRTKINQPLTRRDVISRPLLQQRLLRGLINPLTLVTAPAGFGKTTLVAFSLARCSYPVAWLSLDQNDNQPENFLVYLISALQTIDDQIGAESLQLVLGLQHAPYEIILAHLINDLDKYSKEIVLALDDYQLISNHEVHDQMTFLLDHCPSNFHLVIITRSDPPLPLARLRARSQIVELRSADLRFSETDAAQFLNEMMGLSLDQDLTDSLSERTEGWIAGLQMAALSMRNRNDIRGFVESFSGTHRYILDYLLEEVLERQPAEIQRFLLQTSVLNRLTAPLCDAITTHEEEDSEENESTMKYPDSRSILDHLEKSNLFLIALDDDRHWYRYHHLFADLLKARLQQSQPDLIPRLHEKAAEWLEHEGFISGAVDHLIEAHRLEEAARLIEQYGPGYMEENNLSVFQMSNRLPQEILISRPVLAVYLAWINITRGQIEKAKQLIEGLCIPEEDTKSSFTPNWVHTICSTMQAFFRPEGVSSNAHPLPDITLLEEIPASAPLLRNAADTLYGMTLARQQKYDQAVDLSLRCIQREKKQNRAYNIPTLAPFLTRIYLMLGRLHDSARLSHEFLTPIREKGYRYVYTSGSMMIDLGEVLYEWNQLDEAEKYIRDGLESNEPWENIMTDGFGLIALTRLLLARGDYRAALQIAEKFEKRMQIRTRPHEFNEDLHTLKIHVQLVSGDLPGASHWAEEILQSEDYRLHPSYYRLMLARIRFAQGRFSEVEKYLVGVDIENTVGSHITRQLEVNLLQAAALSAQNRRQEAMELIEASLALAESEGYIRVFLDQGEPVRELLSAYSKTNTASHLPFTQRMLDAFPTPRIENAAQSPQARLPDPLSERELEVLQLLARGMTNQQIAEQLIVARGTIKAHAASIYRKLNAGNRTEAVARARELGIPL